ncbi:LuxR C-terminal-related transcriptional regulator [Yinghuangia sp. ASG 101]|uniref:helix-turn-helix transcriptional regulator n=1 Tax=Yinghuangia sp. ASG 101 TaxID=2896848 RepID=UPI001E37F1FE|nr:LuxR family transcriptional regulator [Yinghuangia sp. ASG 101]UGQ12647.1 LuxR C-terminal-related transcriptional regulator [Yinghuangia sp. ASG 101]
MSPHTPASRAAFTATGHAHLPATATRMRGRERQVAQFLCLIDAARSGPRHGGVFLVEGPSGAGRSRLLAEAATVATRSGFSVGYAAADEVRRAIPLAPLAGALDHDQDPAAPVAATTAATTSVPAPTPGVDGQIDRLRVRLETRLRHGPALLVLDDLHWADHATLAALHTLVTRFAAQPVVWALARSGDVESTAERLFAALREAVRTEPAHLGPLTARAIAELTADRLAAEPEHDLLAYLDGAEGNPAALVTLLDGLTEEHRVHIADGRARLADPAAHTRPPHRFNALVRRRVAALQPRTRQLLDVAGVLGRTSVPDDMSRILGEPTAAMLPALQEALASGIVVCEEDTVAFRNELVRQALLDTIPTPLRGALHRQAADMILTRDGSVLSAAEHLVHGARRGDAQAVAVLCSAATEVAVTEPRTAGELARYALEITAPADPARTELQRVAVEALTRSGPPHHATALAEEALAGPLPAEQAAELRYGLCLALLLGGRPDEAVGVAEHALRQPESTVRLPKQALRQPEYALRNAERPLRHLGLTTLPADRSEGPRDHAGPRAESAIRAPEIMPNTALNTVPNSALRERTTLARLHGLAQLDAAAAAEETREEIARRGTEPSAGLLCVLAETHWQAGRIDDAVRLTRTALTCETPSAAWPFPAALTLTAMLIRLRDHDEARTRLAGLVHDIDAQGWPVLHGAATILEATLALTQGALATASARAAAGLSAADGASPFAPLGRRVLVEVALRRGDLASAGEHADLLADAVAHRPEGDAARAARAAAAWTTARLAAARHDAPGADAALATAHADPAALRRLCAEEPSAAAWLVRADAEAGTAERAAETVRVAERLAADNADTPALQAAAAHARGVHRRDRDALRVAADTHRDSWARASASEDLGVLLHGDRAAAVPELERAMEEYAGAGAERDEARVRRRLRRLGVRRRHWTHADRPTTGWGSLTETERTVAGLVAQGLTNRQVAAQMFLSPHTIGFHLRQIFRKLRVQSRIELVRMYPGLADGS